jgi:hypothetical protein
MGVAIRKFDVILRCALFARLEGWAAHTVRVILRGSPKRARTSSDNGEAVTQG